MEEEPTDMFMTRREPLARELEGGLGAGRDLEEQVDQRPRSDTCFARSGG
jgi:hypothetical protein